MALRLYYSDSFLSEFDARVVEVREHEGRTAVVLDQTAFYPTSGGQVCDTGWLQLEDGARRRVAEVTEDASGEVLHFVAPTSTPAGPVSTRPVHGAIDLPRRLDHMRQHSGQHVLSAAFLRLFEMPTVSFHMGEETCTIDLDAKSLTDAQVRQAEELASSVIMEDRPVEIRSATVDEARALGVRKIPLEFEGELRLIDIRNFDLNACGGTHVRSTGQIGPLLVRKVEKVKQGIRVEFVCGERALATARRDHQALSEAAGIYTTHLWDVPQQVRKSLDEIKSSQKERKRLLEELAELHAAHMLAQASPGGRCVIGKVFPDRDLAFIKLLAQKLASADSSAGVVALLGATGGPQPALVFAQTAGAAHDMAALMKEAMTTLAGRGGGTRDLAQGGAPAGADVQQVIDNIAARVR